jgi:DnaK suppressor protein
MAKKKIKKVLAPSTHLKRRRSPVKAAPIREVVRGQVSADAKKVRSAPAVPLTADQIEKFRDVLSQKRDDLLAIVQRKKEEEIQDVGVGDEADVATHSVEKEMLFELTDSEKQTLDMVESALLKLERGVYGTCESCRKPILRMRLQLMPWARYCVTCQFKQETPAGE